MSVLLLPPIFQFFDNNGDPLANGFIDTFAAGTTTRLATYTDSTGTIAAPNPIELNAAGRPTSGSGAIWGEGAYKFVVRDANGVQVGDALDNVISFNSLADATNAYAQTFSGDGTTTVFTASEDLGTDSKALLVSVASGLQEIAVNGSFATDTDWTKGAGWTIAAGVATATGAISTAISQVPVISLVAGQAYAVTYTITRSAGSLTPSLGGQTGNSAGASGTYREIIIAAATTPIAFTGSGFTGTLDNVSITVATSQQMALLPSNAYTVNGTSITFASAPALGVNNIDVRAPSLLLGAASSAAALAQLYAANALVSETNAAASAALAASVVKWKPAVACATTANITLSGEQTIDTVLTSASRVLVKDQTNATQNGVYVSAAGAWTRAADADTWTEIVQQAVFTSGGSANINKSWVNTNESGGTVGSDNITWTQLDAFGTLSVLNDVQDFRLTLTTAVPVTTADVTGATTIYCTPYKGNSISLYNGTNWNTRISAQFSLALGTLTSGRPYDVFCYDSAGTPTLEFLAWTNDTTRATALAYFGGVLTKSGDSTRRYLGTFYTTATTTTEDSAARRYLFNYNNRVPRGLYATDPTASWNYTTATTRAANANTTYGQGRVGVMTGVAEDAASVARTSTSNNGTGGTGQYSGLGINSTTVFSAQTLSTSTTIVPAVSSYHSILPLGMNYLQALEHSVAAGTTTWYGASGISSGAISGISGTVMA